MTANAGNDVTICEGNSTTLIASGGDEYLWSTGETSASIEVGPNISTTYNVTVTRGTESDTDSVEVTVNELPIANAGDDVIIIPGESITLNAIGGNSYLWSNGSTTQNITVSPNISTTYSVTVTTNGCSSTDSVFITVEEEVIANAGNDITICAGSNTILTATGGTDYLWDNGATTASIEVNPSETTSYSVTVSNGSVSNSDSVIVTVNELPLADAGMDESITRGQSITLNASGGNSYQWSNGATSQSITVSPNVTKTYSVTVFKNGCSGTDSVKVIVKSHVVANAGNDITICEGNTTILTATGGNSYLWNTGETTASINVSPGLTTTYSVTVSNGSQSDTDSVIVTVNAIPIADAGNDVTIDEGQSSVLTAEDGGDFYQWSNGSTNQSITVSPNITTEYIVTVFNNSCSSSDSVLVTVNEAVSNTVIANAGSDISICEGAIAILTATGGTEYLWSTGETSQSIEVNPEITTEYTVTVSEGVDYDTDTVIVAVTDLPIASAGNDVTIVGGSSTTLTAEGGNIYQWSNGATTQSIIVNPNVNTSYTVTVSENGCSSTDSVFITVEEEVIANAGNDISICEGNSSTLTATGGTDYLWNNGETTASIEVNPSETTTYTVIVSNGLQSDSDSVIVTVNELPTANAGNDVSIVLGNSVTLTATGGNIYQWSNGASTQSITINPSITTNYIVTVYKNGCPSTDSVLVTVEDSVIANAGNDVTICEGYSTILTATGGTNYLWSTGETTASIEVFPNETTSYSVTVSNGSQTTDMDTVLVTVNPVPVANAGNDITIDQGQSIALTASGGSNYQWSNGSTNQSITVSPNVSTTYSVIVTNNGCSSSDDVKVTVAETVAANAGNDVTICQGSLTTLTASGGTNYLWSTGETSTSIDVSPNQTTTYSVTVSNGFQSDSDSVVVNVNSSPVADAGNDITIINGESVTLSASGGFNYLWSNGSTLQNIIVNPSETTTYSVTVSANGCSSDEDEVTINVVEPVQATISEDVTICSGENTTLIAGGGLKYIWNTGEFTNSIVVDPTHTSIYEVTVTNGPSEEKVKVKVTVIQCNNDSSSTDLIEDESIEDDIEYTVYPNPTTDIINLKLSKRNNRANLQLHDVLGKSIINRVLEPGDNETIRLDLSSYQRGVYILTIIQNGKSFAKKIVLY